MSNPLTSVEPPELWNHFYALTQIPHPSGGEEAVCRYIFDMARNLGLEVSMDTTGGPDFGNVIVNCPASPGYEQAPITTIQNHVDMVALPAERKDFPLDLILDDTMLRARGTTLGADNGIGVAMALCLMTDRKIIHGPLELLFTINEEAGMTGVLGLSEKALKGRFLINIDTQEEGILTICSAGACRSILRLPLKMEPLPDNLRAVRITLTGGKGGHSGLEINSGRANVAQLLARVLYEESKRIGLRVQNFTSGTVMNAIPGEGFTTIVIEQEELSLLRSSLSGWETAFRKEFGSCDGPLRFVLDETIALPESAVSTDATRKVMAFLLSLPHGVYTMSSDIPGLVETSSDVAIVCTTPSELTVTVSQRSMTDPSLDAVVTQCEAVARLAGAEWEHIGKSYGWKPDMASPLLSCCRHAYRETFNTEPRATGLHGMLECGFIKAKYPDMDVISFGPTILDAHAPTKADYVPPVASD
ncbi:MAG: Cytosol non-specific dipeptidase [Syntrophus sp. SKADARSKE-3]|nr:Cytosol non-specific dipeptidase [Syntrophus sp. SKADARSKE-3]